MRLVAALTYIILLSGIDVQSVLFKEQFRTFVRRVATVYHANWRQHFLAEHPYAKNRFKLTTKNTRYNNSSDFIYPMILTVGSCLVHRNLKVARARDNSSIFYVDILNMQFDELPDDWANENRTTAHVACRQILRGIRRKYVFNGMFIEKMTENVHIAWVKRNAHRTIEELTKPYAELPQAEKDKDRRAILIACRLYNEFKMFREFNTTPIDLIQPIFGDE